MKGRAAAFGSLGGRRAAALLDGGRLDDLLVDPAGDEPRRGTVFRAVADRPAKGLGGQFVKLPGGAGFLRGGQHPPGRRLLVQVTGYAEPGKAPPLTDRLGLRGRYVIVTPGAPGVNLSRRIKDPERRAALERLAGEAGGALGAILRSSAAGADDAAIMEEFAVLAARAGKLDAAGGRDPERLLDGPDAHEAARAEWPALDEVPFDDSAADQAEGMRRAEAPLGQGGAAAWIENTRALVAIDVNTGADTSPAAGLKANVALARDLPRQLRCRGLGGQVTIDPAPMPKRDRRRVEEALRAAFRHDPVDTTLVGWTPLGHFELTRSRVRAPL